MYLLISVHRVEDVPLRLYPSHEMAMACQGEWIPAQMNSEFLGFRLIEFGIDGRVTGRSEFLRGSGNGLCTVLGSFVSMSAST
jgi:hypothetical protein